MHCKGFVRGIIMASFFLLLTGGSVSFADDAQVMPKGRMSFAVEAKYYFPVDSRFNQDGNVESAAHDFNGALNTQVFPALGLLEKFFGMPTGSANLGSTVVSFKYDFTLVDNYLFYGITDSLTAGVKIPYWQVRNKVNANVDTTLATVGKNAALNALTPLAVPGTIPLNNEDVQSLIGKGLDINGDGKIDIPGLGFKRFESFSNSGVSDIEAGLKYQYLKTKDWRLAFTGGVRFPTGEKDDPDNLTDYAFGGNAYAILLRANNDYTGIKDVVLDLTLKYDVILSHTDEMRVVRDPNEPLTPFKANVDVDPGDKFEVEVSGKYEIGSGFNASLLYRYGAAQKNKAEVNGIRVPSLEGETDYTEHVFEAYLSYSTIPAFMEKKAPIPMNAFLGYRNRFAGSNNTLKSQYVSLGLQFFF